ncbi:4'-phosphopantetheinyl transferase family protein [Bradyrhizobium sp. SZCCHNRI2049]|uniref:4'-phosphopantetheinyl transferase family protein n=1 Tax=Bradyrhizobium sp. SZCCHNRI2049 TaxID=3057287 RepID=UPI003966BAA3
MAHCSLQACRALLSREELEQERRFHFDHDRIRFLITRAMSRLTLSRYSPILPEEWRFTSNRFGRPEIQNDSAAAQGISFNISHTRELVAVAVGRHMQLGVDVENSLRRAAPIDVASHFFSRREADDLLALPSESQSQRFYEFWTLKEAYIKARGMGLSLPIDKFSFDFSQPGQIEFFTHAALADRACNWRFWQYQVSGEYLLALCADTKQDFQNVLLRRTYPFCDHDEPLNYRLLRHSPPT